MSNPYQVLGVTKEADGDTIKKAFKKLARKYHPDVNQDPKAIEKFKEVNSAYDTLGDPSKRKLYDRFGDASTRPGFDPNGFQGFGGGSPFGHGSNMEDMLSSIFGGGGGGGFRGPRRGPDQQLQVNVDPILSFTGGEQSIRVPSPSGPAQQVKIRIPAGATDGSTLRLKGSGLPPRGGGACGDLLIRLNVHAHAVFRRNGDDLEMDLPITILEALKGGPIAAPTPTGPVKINVPAGAQSGQRLRLRGKGVQRPSSPGNLYIVLRPSIPETISPEALEAAEVLEGYYDADIRAKLIL